VIPESPLAQGLFGLPAPGGKFLCKAIQKRIQVVVLDNEHAFAGVLLVELREFLHQLQSKSRLTAPLFAEDNRRGRFEGATENFGPRRMVRGIEAVLSKNLIRLGILLSKRIVVDAVMAQELGNLHRVSRSSEKGVSPL
jgi:hypothetical protein